MSSNLRKLLYLALIFLVIFLLAQPYNWFCRLSGSCEGIYFSDFAIEKGGDSQIVTLIEVKNHRSDLIFEAIEPRMLYTVTGRKNITKYRVHNISDKKIKFRPKFYVEPKQFTKYVNRRECLCFREYTLEKGESLNLRSVFKFDGDLEKDPNFNKDAAQISIGYEIVN